MWLLPLTRDEAVEAIKRAYGIAQDYARRVGGRVELLQPRHIYGERADQMGYSLHAGKTALNIPPASVVVIWGFYNPDPQLEFVRFIQEGRVYEWFIKPIATYPEKIGVWTEEPPVFRNALEIETRLTTGGKADGWPLGYFITSAQPPQEPPRRKRGGWRERSR
ncbi:MAG: hypothetical protein ACK4M3_07135 [Pyrobaculum sp.]